VRSRSTSSSGRNDSTSPDEEPLTASSGASHGLAGKCCRRPANRRTRGAWTGGGSTGRAQRRAGNDRSRRPGHRVRRQIHVVGRAGLPPPAIVARCFRGKRWCVVVAEGLDAQGDVICVDAPWCPSCSSVLMRGSSSQRAVVDSHALAERWCAVPPGVAFEHAEDVVWPFFNQVVLSVGDDLDFDVAPPEVRAQAQRRLRAPVRTRLHRRRGAMAHRSRVAVRR
jgi:hypothetical protein